MPAATAAPPAAQAASASPAQAEGATFESQRTPFLAACNRKVQAPEYCACFFDQFRAIFQGSDLSQKPAEDDPRLVAVKEKTQAVCASKVPEEQARAGFLRGCIGGESRKTAYCECAWPALRKTMTVADFVGDFSGPRFDPAKRAMAAVCKGTFPLDIARTDFVAVCTKGDVGQKAMCECLWTKLHARYTAEEIYSGLADVHSVPGLDSCK